MGNRNRTFVVKLLAALNVLIIGASAILASAWAASGLAVYSTIGWIVYLVRPSSPIHGVDLFPLSRVKCLVTGVVCTITLLASILPMSLSPKWNGEIPQHRNQYEVLADALIHGKVSVYDDEDTSQLQALENPYDPAQREGIAYHWDHVFYEGKYYVYFGVVPALLVFVPYQLLTGSALTTYHATQLFVALFIVAMFLLIAVIARSFSLRIPFVLYLFLAVTTSIICVLYSIGAPALYCTAIAAGLCFEAWSLVFLFSAVYLLDNKKSQIPVAFAGALCGALVFGCRPPIGLLNIVAIPLLIHYLRGKKFGARLLGTICLMILPYVLVLAMLLAYNYVRFGSPTEFGATYQLTQVDIASYRNSIKSESPLRYLSYLKKNFLALPKLSDRFPYVSFGGAFANYPIFLLVFATLFPRMVARMRERKVLSIAAILLVLPVVITVIDASWSPSLYERYRMDIYLPLSILLCLVVGLFFGSSLRTRDAWVSFGLCMLLLLTIGTCFLFFCSPYDANWVAYDPAAVEPVMRVLSLGM